MKKYSSENCDERLLRNSKYADKTIAKDRNIIRPFPSDVLKREYKLVETVEEKNILVFM